MKTKTAYERTKWQPSGAAIYTQHGWMAVYEYNDRRPSYGCATIMIAAAAVIGLAAAIAALAL